MDLKSHAYIGLKPYIDKIGGLLFYLYKASVLYTHGISSPYPAPLLTGGLLNSIWTCIGPTSGLDLTNILTIVYHLQLFVSIRAYACLSIIGNS